MIVPPLSLDGSRELFALDPALAHLNHGSFGAVPQPVRAARQRLLDQHDANPMGFTVDMLPDQITFARSQLAEFVGADPACSALVVNATTGVAIALRSIDLKAGDEIIITDHSYAAITTAVGDLRDRLGVKLVVAPVPLGYSETATVDAVLERLTDRTRLVIVDQISSATAQLHPVAQLGQALRGRGIPFMVDAAHAPGMIPQAAFGIDADFWVGNMHKWGFAPSGTAVLQVGPQWRRRMVPPVVSHGFSSGFPFLLEQQATRDYTPWIAAPVGLETFSRYGERAIQRHNARLAEYGQQIIGEALGLQAADLPDPGPGVSMRVIPLPASVGRTYAETDVLRHRIRTELSTVVTLNPFNGLPLLRISAQIYNQASEYERLAEGLPALLKP